MNNTQSIEDWSKMRDALAMSLLDALHLDDEVSVARVSQQLRDHGCK